METTAEILSEDTIPLDVIEAFGIASDRIAKVGGGLVNATYYAETDPKYFDSKKVVIQRLSEVLLPEQTADITIVARHLDSRGWEAPLVNNTVADKPYHSDGLRRNWRSLDFIESDYYCPEIIDGNQAEQLGSFLAKWHSVVRWLDYQPSYAIPNFHDLAYRAGQLKLVLPELPTDGAELAREVLDRYESLAPLPGSPSQIIHGDPKLSNVLFRQGKPLSLIDFDTLMIGPIWADIGDMTRSMLKTNELSGYNLGLEALKRFSIGYYDASRPEISLSQFTNNTLLANSYISLELIMRYLNDAVEGSYFSWDCSRYSSHTQSHIASALLQWKIISELKEGQDKCVES